MTVHTFGDGLHEHLGAASSLAAAVTTQSQDFIVALKPVSDSSPAF